MIYAQYSFYISDMQLLFYVKWVKHFMGYFVKPLTENKPVPF